jgi:hypothetical protein
LTIFVAEAKLDHTRGWITVPIEIDQVFGLTFLVSVFSRSVVKPDVIQSLALYFHEVTRRRYRVTRATFGGQPIELQVLASPIALPEVMDGILGMDFLQRFADLNLNLQASTLSLVEP